MFKLHNKQQLSGSIHSGHFMVSRLDDDDDENNDVGDDTSESERDNAQSVEIDVNNPESVADVANNLDSAYRVESPSSKNELVTSWNDLDRPAKRKQKQHQYLTYYTNTSSSLTPLDEVPATVSGLSSCDSASAVPMDARITRALKPDTGEQYGANSVISSTALALNATSNAASSVVSNSASRAVVSSYISDEHGAMKRICINQDGLMGEAHPMTQEQLAALHSGAQAAAACGHAHAVTIDTSLTKLLECMSLYYSSKLTSPKWKSFKGLKLRMKYKIRLNNLIWRAWFLQCIRGRRPPGCQFTAPAENEVHKKSETIVLEGKYWKRKEKAIADEYKKWRIFHSKRKSQLHCFRPSSFDWESRASSLATSSMMYVPEYSFYPDYDMNIGYSDDLPPMLEELEQRDQQQQQQAYYQQQQPLMMQEQHEQATANESSSPTGMIEPPAQHQEEQQMQEQQQNTMTSVLTPQINVTTHQQLQQHRVAVPLHHQQQQHQPQQQQHQHQQLSIQVSGANQMHQQQQQHTKLQHAQQHQQALMLKTERSPIIMNQSQQILSTQQPINASLANFMPQAAQQQQPLHNSMQTSLHRAQQQQQQQQQPSFALDQNPLYQQLQQQQMQQQHSQISPQMSQQQQQQEQSMYMCQDLSSLSSSASGSSFGGTGRTEQRRVTHINAEQKRRCSIKNGFETLRSILPSINQNVNVKVSKASMLQKAAVCISQLTAEQKQYVEEQDMLKQQIEQLKQGIRAYQSQLPSSGAVIGGHTSSQAREMLQTYVRRRALENWKFWIFSLLIEPLFETYYSTVNTNSLEEACKTIYSWLDQSCGLNSLRRDALESMTRLSKSTNVLTNPQTLPSEAFNAVRYTTPNSQSIINSNASSPSMLTVASTNGAQQQPQLVQAPPATISGALPAMAAAAAVAAAASSTSSTTNNSMPIGLMAPRSQHLHQQQLPHLQHQQLQQIQQQPHHFQVIQTTSQQQQVQQATNNSLQPHSIRTVW